jgi:hypothetical protein
MFVWVFYVLLDLQKRKKKFSEAKSQKFPIVSFWLMRAIWLLENSKAKSLKVVKSSNKQG